MLRGGTDCCSAVRKLLPCHFRFFVQQQPQVKVIKDFGHNLFLLLTLLGMETAATGRLDCGLACLPLSKRSNIGSQEMIPLLLLLPPFMLNIVLLSLNQREEDFGGPLALSISRFCRPEWSTIIIRRRL